MRPSVIVRSTAFSAVIALAAFGGSPLCAPAFAASDLTGLWAADSGAVYYVREVGSTVWWAGFDPDTFSRAASESNSFQRGLTSAQVFWGTITGDVLSGEWAEVPRQSSSTLGQGTLTVLLARDSLGDVVRLQTQTQTGGLTVANWTRSTIPALPCTKTGGARDPYCLFAKVLKNQTETFWGSHESLLDNLKPYKDNAVIFGTVSEPYRLSLSGGSGFTCSDFFKFHNIDDDLTFDITADRQNLDAQPGFWTNGWINAAGVIQGKLDAWENFVHCEIIMFGRQNADCTAGDPVFLPGWAENGANSALVNGTPVDAGVAEGENSVVIQGQALQMKAGSRVRVTGPLVLDCGHGLFSPCYETTNDHSNPDSENLEIHPVYSVDLLQDFTVPRSSNVDLTGSWAASDVGTYYVCQIGNTVWWLGLTSDQGLTFTNVFRGTLQGGTTVPLPVSNAPVAASADAARRSRRLGVQPWFPVITGQWASLPLGSTQGNGDLTLGGTFCKNLNDSTVPCDPSQPPTAWNLLVTQNSSSPLFANPPNNSFQWQKLFDEQTSAAPQIAAPAVFPLGPVANGIEAAGSIPISNVGTAPLVIQSISKSPLELTFSPSTLTIAPGTTATIAVRWLVANATRSGNQIYDGYLTLTTNDPSAPHASVTVQLTVRGGPAR